MQKSTLLLFALMFFAQNSGWSQEGREPIVLKSQKVDFFNYECEETNSCDLKRVEYVVEKYKIDILGVTHYGKRLVALYETGTVSALQNYTFIQFVIGCRYYSWVQDGETKIYFGYSVKHGEEWVTACFSNWVIDTDNKYPDYCADPENRSRNFTCRWKNDMQNADFFTRDGVKLYGEETPRFPALYISDYPSGVYAIGNFAINNSFVLRTCLYKTADVPRVVDLSDTQFAEPLYCFEWRNAIAYNHAKKRFEEPKDIVIGCKQHATGKEVATC